MEKLGEVRKAIPVQATKAYEREGGDGSCIAQIFNLGTSWRQVVTLASKFVKREYNREHHAVLSGYLSQFTKLNKTFLTAVHDRCAETLIGITQAV
jgi:hypothetical protein